MKLQQRLNEAIDRLVRCKGVRTELISIGGCEETIGKLNEKIHQLEARRALLESQIFELEREIETATI